MKSERGETQNDCSRFRVVLKVCPSNQKRRHRASVAYLREVISSQSACLLEMLRIETVASRAVPQHDYVVVLAGMKGILHRQCDDRFIKCRCSPRLQEPKVSFGFRADVAEEHDGNKKRA